MQAGIAAEIDKTYMRMQGTQNSQNNIIKKRNIFGEFTLLHYYNNEDRTESREWYWHKDRYINLWIRIVNPRINPYIFLN